MALSRLSRLGSLTRKVLVAVAIAVWAPMAAADDPLAEALAVLEDGLRPVDVRDERVHRLLDDQPHADRGGEVVHDVAAVDELVDDRRLQHRVDHEVEVAALAQVRDVSLRAGGEVVEDADFAARGGEGARDVRADEAGAAGDENVFHDSNFWSALTCRSILAPHVPASQSGDKSPHSKFTSSHRSTNASPNATLKLIQEIAAAAYQLAG